MNETQNIPLLDLVTPHLELQEELVGVFKSALGTASFIGGSMVHDFERDFANFCAADYCVGVGSGTDALRFALIAAGVKAGDTVITVPNTFIATVEAISQAGARPAFLDIDEGTYNLSPEKLREYLETQCDTDPVTGTLIDLQTRSRVAAIVPVHLYGQMADMDPILELAERYNLIVVEDACQAHGAEYFSKRENRWCKAGSMGKAAAFSFYPGKNLGACGEAGAVTTNDQEIEQQVRMLRDHGQSQKYYHKIEGYNGRLDAIQAGFLNVKLRFLSEWNEKRRERAATYNELLAGADESISIPFEPSWTKPVYHLFVIRTQDRDQLRRFLSDAGIGTGIHYPVPLHLQDAYQPLGYQEGDFPVAESAAREVMSLPMYPQLKPEQQTEVAGRVLSFLASRPTDRASVGAPV